MSHDSIFDFTRTPAGFSWLDDLAAAAQAARDPPRVAIIGHSDWYMSDLRFAGEAVVAVYDWDSLVADTEPVRFSQRIGGWLLSGAR